MVNKYILAGALAFGLTTAAQANNEHIVVLTGFSYFPAVTYVKSGDTVVFVNESGETQTVVAKDSGWTVGPLDNETEGALTVEDDTELLFFAAYCDQDDVDAAGNCGLGTNAADTTQSGDDAVTDPSQVYGTYDGAPIKAEISFDAPPQG